MNNICCLEKIPLFFFFIYTYIVGILLRRVLRNILRARVMINFQKNINTTVIVLYYKTINKKYS